MHREIKLKEDGVVIATFYSDHNLGGGQERQSRRDDTLRQDIRAFLDKIDAKFHQDWSWGYEIRRALELGFPYLAKKSNGELKFCPVNKEENK